MAFFAYTTKIKLYYYSGGTKKSILTAPDRELLP